MSASASSKASKRAADAQVQASREANELQREIYYDQRGLLAPTAIAGASAAARQMLMLGYTPEQVKSYLQKTDAAYATPSGAPSAPGAPSGPGGGASSGSPSGGVLGRIFRNQGFGGEPAEAPEPTTVDAVPGQDYSWVDEYDPDSYLQSTPGYQFRFDEGQRALERSKAASGDFYSGDTAMALTRYGQDYGSNEWGNLFNQLGALSGSGQANTANIVNAAGNYGQQAGNNIIRAGDARATGYANSGAAWSNFYGGLGGYIGGLANKWG